ncbi:MAG: aspartate carbamoyltransferase catalytic subunit [Planctomycetota bacterium]
MSTSRHLTSLRETDAPRIRTLLAAARDLDAADQPLKGERVATMFFENSTRTRTSFAAAATMLGATVLDASGSGTSVSKGESLVDTAHTVAAMGVRVLVIRHAASGAAELVARSFHPSVGVSVINAGDGRHQHPTQGLLDAYAFAEATARLGSLDFTGLRTVLCGDIVSSRVARSTTAVFAALGSEVTLVGPRAFLPASGAGFGSRVRLSTDLDAEIEAADAVMMLRTQFERHTGPSPVAARAFRARYALSAERVARLRPDAVILHPGPMNRGVEIDAAAAGDPRSRVAQQVSAGVRVRAAVLRDAVQAAGVPLEGHDLSAPNPDTAREPAGVARA